MFIQNNIGEVVNIDQILAIRVYDDAKPYEIHVFTEKTETVFEFEDEERVRATSKRLGYLLAKTSIRWVQCCNWMFRADKIISVNESSYRDLKVYMIGRDFKIYFGLQDNGEELAAAKNQIAESLAEDHFNSGTVVFERLE